MTEEPEALRLADAIDGCSITESAAAEELRHLHKRCEELEFAWNKCMSDYGVLSDNYAYTHKHFGDTLKAYQREVSINEQLLVCLKDCVEDSESVVADHIERYGENYKTLRLAEMRRVVADAHAAIAAAELSFPR